MRAGEIPLPELITERLAQAEPVCVTMESFVPDLKSYDSLLTEVSA